MSKPRENCLSDVELDMIFRRFGVEGDMTMGDRKRDYPVEELKPHPQNELIYGCEDIADLVEQIKAFGGIVDPLKIKEDGSIVSGHRRWRAAQALGMKKVPCEIVGYDSEEAELAALVMFNQHRRAKSNEQKAREGMALEDAFKEEGMQRRLMALKQNQPDGDPGTTSENDRGSAGSHSSVDAGGKRGRTRDLIADFVKIGSGKTFDRMKAVIKEADALNSAGNSEDAAFLLKLLNKSVKPAYNLVNAGYASLPDDKRMYIRNTDGAVEEFLENRNNDKPRSMITFKKAMKNLVSTEQTLSATAQGIDSLNGNEAEQIKATIAQIKKALLEVEARLK